MKIVIAPDSFKESLSAPRVCEAIAAGVRAAAPDAQIDLIPMADGGEGTVEALVKATCGRYEAARVFGPLGEPVDARFGLLGSGRAQEAQRPTSTDRSDTGQRPGGQGVTAVIEMAAASGLPLVPPDRRDPTRTTTYGTGQLIAAALEAGARRIIVGIGGSATTDGGAGAAQAVGVRFLRDDGSDCVCGLAGGGLADVSTIDVSRRDPRLDEAEIIVACDVDNPLCGPRGAAAVYGPQKGASPEMVTTLDRNVAHLADVIERDLGRRVRDVPGAGAAGGLGAGLIAFFDATLRPGAEIVIDAVGLERRVRGAQLVITGEGRLDEQSMMGKVVSGVARVAKRCGVPVIALAGSVGDGAAATLEVLDAYFPIVNRPMPLEEAMRNAGGLLTEAAANVLRAVRLLGPYR